jgi:hypothetical protein|tara:strand:+ start:7159 stop:7743 length:585 start_codon:yes stop_codon:yes gene_type:complete
MKKYKLPKDSFIGGWFIPEKVCDRLVSYFNKNKSMVVQGEVGENKIKKQFKESFDIQVFSDNYDPEILEYRQHLQIVLENYIKEYPEVDKYDRFNVSSFNIQKYPPNGGFKVWHFERGSNYVSNRMLVFMTYLNTIKNGGTHFKYQKRKIPAIKGLTVIWPTDFTHTHKGVITNKEKMIATGWFALYPHELQKK